MKKLDVVIIVCVIIGALFFTGVLAIFIRGKYETKYVEVYVDNKLYRTISLNEKDKTEIFTVKNGKGTNTIKVQRGGVSIIDANCPDKVCVYDGFIDKPGQVLVCLPNKVVVEIKGQKKSEVDELAY
jgi:hypothetical protein